MNKINIGMFSLVLTLFFVIPSEASAKKNKKLVNHGVCNSVKDASPGLFGLCVAYCEAQVGPDIVNPDDISSLKPSHKNILRNYERRMKNGDPQMPCVNYASACPVFSDQELIKMNEITADFYEEDHEYISANNGALIFRESVRSIIYDQYLPNWLDGRTSALISALVASSEEQGITSYTGQYYDRELTVFRFQELTKEEFYGCKLAMKNNILDNNSNGYCGDGLLTSGPEQCDDGNNMDGDGCSAICVLE